MNSKNPTVRALSWAAFWLIVLIVLFYVLFPFYWAIKTSVTGSGQLSREALLWWPNRATFQNFTEVFTNAGFLRNLLNSVVVASGTVIISLLLSALAAYALGKFRFRGKSVLMYIILAVSVFPQIAVLSGLYTMIRGFGLYNSWWGLILSYMIFTLPFTVWTLTSFVREIPTELEEAAYVDGASPLQTLFQVLLPVMTPALVTTGLLAFINAWNEYLFALTFTSDNTASTVPVAIANFSGATQYETPFGLTMAASVIVTVPLLILVLVFQRNIVSGLTAGAVKG
ncbi:maltose ABC transporter membrane protein /trehalose ABC transporter membrane protein /sucrose ABC transporter membrane protein /palatinose ABC transporter membrane protein [Deinococcus reticulitermitis]|uniref:Maltose ABC transporter membrane protein /trehalose ABC transporter membrane protein /sucrose ABC transporter membrane protein /palatinose ABC transporter membrane protein n=1 Tax=Deinococcus reticulitermitis TaxID=856736 RepID=A0A1H7AFC0_9DEIO|nr:carbohydrate ABC transporter permease [Deinococcus reticulitermitis]SEJ63264.1 maltose ABC transporter membrane protein /trehalose ABC transporter membrane protein /sucrose ABC transporter membrane protein /palatinose ABC transporter membrane protein [Deinococcus reticulitermitis]